MVPLEKVKAASRDVTVGDLRDLVRESGHSRIPLYEGNREMITHFVRAADLVGKDPEAEVTFAVPALEVGAEEPISAILQRFQSVGRHLAVVCDAGGRARGILTLEDVVEEIVGDIEDEYEKR
jgi:magnesium and cobalt transporter